MASWSRPPVGIIRAEVEFSRYLAESFPTTSRFCVFSGIDLAYHEISLQDCLSLIETLQRPRAEITSLQAKQTVQRFQARDTRRSALKDLSSRFSCRIRKWLSKFYNLAFNGGRFRLPIHKTNDSGDRNFDTSTTRHTTLNGLQINVEIANQALNPFSRDDTFVSMGLDWDQKDFSVVSKVRNEFALKVVWLCYDLIPIKFPHLCADGVPKKFSGYFKDVASVADLILCISKSTQLDLASYFAGQKCAVPLLDVIHLGCTLPPSGIQHSSQAVDFLVGTKYLLYVSTIERRKNHETLYRAYVKLIDSGLTDLPPLVFVGMQGWGVSDFLNDLKLDFRVKDKIILLTDLNDADLAAVYKGSYLTLYPSLYEGWGLPVAESLAYGKFCLASNSSSIPEVGSGLLEYIDPWDVPSWADRIFYYVSNPAEVKRREEAIKEKYRVHSWVDSGAAIYAACSKLYNFEESACLKLNDREHEPGKF